jgi:hypothetical protein
VALVLRSALPDRHRSPRGREGVSECRVGTGAQAAAGQRDGTAGTEMGTAYLHGACAAAAVPWSRAHPAGQRSLTRVEHTPGQGKASTVLAHQPARAVCDLGPRQPAVDLATLLDQA